MAVTKSLIFGMDAERQLQRQDQILRNKGIPWYTRDGTECTCFFSLFPGYLTVEDLSIS